MNPLKIAASVAIAPGLSLNTTRDVVTLDATDFTDVAAVVLSLADTRSGVLMLLRQTGFNLPVFVANAFDTAVLDLPGVTGEINGAPEEWQALEQAAREYEAALLPPFFDTLTRYVDMQNSTFACPGHQGGAFFRRHPAGRQFYDFYGENLFRSDMCNADVRLGDLLIHEGSAKDAQKFAARVFNADKTYFVLNGTSSANKVVTNALLTRGDLVLFDRNNHKSNHHGALLQAGATPVYLEAARNPFGLIGGIDAHCFDEDYLRAEIAQVAPDRARQARPFRLAIIQLGTYDGTVYNARQVVDRIGHLCDYILFDSAWLGYEQFIPLMAAGSPLTLTLTKEDPGIFVTQSVHKQLAGFSQTSQIHKKDNHIRGQQRFCPHKRLNNAFMLHASTSPFYPLFAALDINARMHQGEAGRSLWHDCVIQGIEARKAILQRCTMIKPFLPAQVHGAPWQQADSAAIARDPAYFSFEPDAEWHGFSGYAPGQYQIDPCKLLLTTPGIDAGSGAYSDFGIPATILANYLRENGIVPEKCDLNSILFLLTPAESAEKMSHLVAMLEQFEQQVREDAPLAEVLPSLYRKHAERYRGYTLRRLCQEMHDLYVSFAVKDLQKAMFRADCFPPVAVNPQDAHQAYIRGDVELVPVAEAEGRIAAEGALPYPPGVLCVVPGEVWGGAVQHYFLELEAGINQLPGFSPELQGVYIVEQSSGYKQLVANMLA